MTADVHNITQCEDCACISRDDSDMCYPPAVGISNVSERREKSPGRNGYILSAAPGVKHGLDAHGFLSLRVFLQNSCRQIQKHVKCYNSLSVSISNKSRMRLISKGSGLEHNELMASVMSEREERISNQKQTLLKVGRVLPEQNIHIWFSRLI